MYALEFILPLGVSVWSEDETQFDTGLIQLRNEAPQGRNNHFYSICSTAHLYWGDFLRY